MLKEAKLFSTAEITCPVIPEGRAYQDVEGIVESCSNDIGDECHFLCHPGHVRARGSATVTCLFDGSWSGGWPPMCTGDVLEQGVMKPFGETQAKVASCGSTCIATIKRYQSFIVPKHCLMMTPCLS